MLDESTLATGGTESAAGTAGAGGSTPAPNGGSSAGDVMQPPAGSSSGGGGAGGSAEPSSGSSGASGAGGVGGAAGSGGAGGVSGSGGNGGSGGTPDTTGHRFAKLVAKSEQAGAVWSSVAELQLYTSGDALMLRNNWVVTADSQELDDQQAPATAAVDGDTATFWHSSWEPGGAGDAVLPHELIVDMGSAYAVTGFSYLPRQTGENGRIAAWEFYVSKDGVSWGTAVKTGTFIAGASLQKISF